MILHVDMDAFYASVEERDRPELAGQPVIVGGSADSRGVVSAANYEVRKFGVHSAMPMKTAVRLCPHAVVLPVRMDHYASVSQEIRAIFNRFTPLVEPLALDEAFLDVGGCESLFGEAPQIGAEIKRVIREEVGLVASVGVAPNKFLAKVASDLDKPDGLVIVEADRIHEFLDPLPVSRLWGVGRRAEEILLKLGIHEIGQLRRASLRLLQEQFGEASATHLHELAHGRDTRAVVPDREAKSISHETTFAVDISDVDVLRACLLSLTEQVARRLRRLDVEARTVHLKVRYSDFRTVTRSHSMPNSSSATNALWQAVAGPLLARVDLTARPVRLLGVGVSSIGTKLPKQRLLFDEDDSDGSDELDSATDQIRDRFGSGAIRRGATLNRGRRDRRPDSG